MHISVVLETNGNIQYRLFNAYKSWPDKYIRPQKEDIRSHNKNNKTISSISEQRTSVLVSSGEKKQASTVQNQKIPRVQTERFSGCF